MNIGEHKYKNIKIWYDDYGERWECELGGKRFGKETLKEVRVRIDKFFKAEKQFERFNTIYIGGGWRGKETFDVVTVTSQTEDGDYWTVNKDGKRSKETPSQLVMDTPDNQAVVEKIKTLMAEQESLQEREKKMLNSLTCFPGNTPGR